MRPLPEQASQLLDAALVGELTVVRPDGRPVTYPLIPLRDGDRVYMTSSTLFSKKLEHIAANPRVSLSITDPVAVGGAAGRLTILYQVSGIGPTLAGWNGGGDRYFTDGEMTVGVLAIGNAGEPSPEKLPNPPAVTLKNRAWSWLRPLLR